MAVRCVKGKDERLMEQQVKLIELWSSTLITKNSTPKTSISEFKLHNDINQIAERSYEQ